MVGILEENCSLGRSFMDIYRQTNVQQGHTGIVLK